VSDTNALRLRIAEELNRQPSDLIGSPFLSVGLVINREINNAIKHYESTRFRWNEVREQTLFTTVSGQRTYSLPADFIRMDTLKLIYNNAYIPLKKRTWEEIESLDRQVTVATGVPNRFTIYGNVVRLYSVPNQALTAIGSYIRRDRPTSLSGSFCSVIAFAGSSSLTATSTASHNNQLNGWTTDGEELIRSRAKASVQIKYLYDEGAIAEMRQLRLTREPYLSIPERLAYERLADETNDALSSGRIQPYHI